MRDLQDEFYILKLARYLHDLNDSLYLFSDIVTRFIPFEFSFLNLKQVQEIID